MPAFVQGKKKVEQRVNDDSKADMPQQTLKYGYSRVALLDIVVH
jgi:hypothetical protein